ncbi:MAG: AarF/UbiB family protein [Thermodesulfobacteriota bacterium]|nr:AarF/UbiB family protein [Thermodesulfobacteriota bacterium]
MSSSFWGVGVRVFVSYQFAETLEKELDYTLEASNMERVAQQVIFNSTIHIPKVFLEQTTTNVLTMEYIDGIKVSEIEKLDAKGFDKHLLTQHGADFIMMQVFEYGFFHGDLHPGNLFVLPGNVLCPVDFGMMGFIDQHTRDMFIDLIASIVMQNMSMACRYLLELTEYDEEPELRRLEKDIADFTGQYLSKSLKDINMGRLLQDLLKITFRHKLRMYPETFLMMKSFASVEGVAHILDPYFDMVKHAAPYIKHAKAARFTPKKISNDLTMASLEGIQFLQDFPRESIGVIRQLRKRQLVVGFDFKGLEKVLLTHHQVNNRISLSIIIAALIIGAALILCFKIPPLFLGISIIGIAGFILAAVLGIWFKLGN